MKIPNRHQSNSH